MSVPCEQCPWVSKDPRDQAAVSSPEMQAAMRRGEWFCCHVRLGQCHGARLLSEQAKRGPPP